MVKVRTEKKKNKVSFLYSIQYLFTDADVIVAAPPTKKRKLDEDASAAVKKSKTNEDEDGEEEVEVEDDEDELDEEDDVEEDDEPAVKTKVIKGSETKQAAAHAKNEEYEEEA